MEKGVDEDLHPRGWRKNRWSAMTSPEMAVRRSMSKQDRGGDRSNNGDEASPRVLKGPWDNLPATKTTREPILKRGARGRETIISSWRGLAIFIFLLVCAPPIVAWVTRFIMGLVAQR